MAEAPQITSVTTTRDDRWVAGQAPVELAMDRMPDVFVLTDAPLQRVEGFGACFNELGWDALEVLDQADRDAIMDELFNPGVGANLNLCRTSIAANDFSRDWYSYDDIAGDHALQHFTIEHDLDSVVPFIKAAQSLQPQLKLWASPWSPPVWLKTNGHYACARPNPMMDVENGIADEQLRDEGTDTFDLTGQNLDTYARYFGKYVDAYAEQGIRISMVMPQNEFNSAQSFPSCTWTPDGLREFIKVLGPEMAQRDVELFFGTLERPDDHLIDATMDDPDSRQWVKGFGTQWAGKGAIAAIHHDRPELRLYQSEQECGDGKNDWRYARYAWTMMRHYFNHGANAYDYWNIALMDGGVSRWGWRQNSFVTVRDDGSFSWNHDYFIFKHVSHFVQPGAQVLRTLSYTGFENQLAFVNPDGSIVLAIQNDSCEEQRPSVLLGDRLVELVLPADSLSTFVVAPGTLG